MNQSNETDTWAESAGSIILGIHTYQAILQYVRVAERIKRLGYVSGRFPEWIKLYAAWDLRRIEAGFQNWGP